MTASPTPCPDEAAIGRLLVGEIDREERRAILGHAADCEPCCDLLAALQSTSKPRAKATATSGTVDRYRIVAPLGAGGAGVVYSAHDTRLDRPVALKVLHEDVREEGDVTEQMLLEARAMARLSHPNVVRVFDVGVASGHVFVAMELVEGGTLRAWLREAPRPWRDILDRFVQAGRGLAAAHRAGMIHRDFKPANLLVREGNVLVTDFGLARMVAQKDAVTVEEGMPLGHWEATNIAGTPMYMAPEQIRGESLDARADIFSFSVALWESLHGTRPFSGSDPNALLASIRGGPAAPPKGDVPAYIDRALARGMSFERGARHASIEALLAELERDAPKNEKVVRRTALWAAAGVAALTVVGWRASRTATAPPTTTPTTTTTPSASVTSATTAPPILASTNVALPTVSALPSILPAPRTAATPPLHATSASTSRVPPRGSSPSPTVTVSPERHPMPAIRYALTRLEPFGEDAEVAREALESQIGRFTPCLELACIDESRAGDNKSIVHCSLRVDNTGRVTSADCPHYAGDRKLSCAAGEQCTAAAFRAMRLPPPSEGAGRCAVQLHYVKKK